VATVFEFLAADDVGVRAAASNALVRNVCARCVRVFTLNRRALLSSHVRLPYSQRRIARSMPS
jgi:hypothetical protein